MDLDFISEMFAHIPTDMTADPRTFDTRLPTPPSHNTADLADVHNPSIVLDSEMDAYFAHLFPFAGLPIDTLD